MVLGLQFLISCHVVRTAGWLLGWTQASSVGRHFLCGSILAVPLDFVNSVAKVPCLVASSDLSACTSGLKLALDAVVADRYRSCRIVMIQGFRAGKAVGLVGYASLHLSAVVLDCVLDRS